jgi:hypothetical protein
MTRWITTLSLVFWASAACGEQTLRDLSWGTLPAARPPAAGTVQSADATAGFPYLRIVHAEDVPTRLTVLTLDAPGVTGFPYAIAGSVRYEGVRGQGYLEMWSAFPGGGRYFSRTLGSGLLRPLQGTTGWRPFVLPMFADAGTSPPAGLTLNVVLAGRGTVDLGPLRLVQYGPGEDPLAAPGQWWSERTGGLVGGGLGGTIGLLGAVIGWLTSRGAARGFVLGTTKTLVALGVAVLAAGIVAMLRGQPWAVSYPLNLAGLLTTVIFGALLPSIRRRYDAVELRRMQAADAR